MHMILPFPRFEEAERVLFIAPHPDDIEVAAGATAAKLAAMGKNVRFLVAAAVAIILSIMKRKEKNELAKYAEVKSKVDEEYYTQW